MKPRPARYPEDLWFVLGNWKASHHRSPRAGPIPDEIYDKVMDEILKIALLRPGVRTAVMEEETSEGPILKGFAVARPPDVILYCYTKQQYREQGVCRRLLQELGVDLAGRLRCCFWTDDARRKLMNGRGRWLLTYNPRLVRYPLRTKETVNG